MATPDPAAFTAIGEFTVNSAAVEVQLTLALEARGLLKVTIEVVAAPPKVCAGKVIAVVVAGTEVNGANPAGQVRLNVSGIAGDDPRTSLQVRV